MRAYNTQDLCHKEAVGRTLLLGQHKSATQVVGGRGRKTGQRAEWSLSP